MKILTYIKYIVFCFVLTTASKNVFAQGKNHNFQLGYIGGIGTDTNVTTTRATLNYNGGLITVIPDSFRLPFLAAQANMSDENGNLIISTNGCWIADATGDTMQNGGGLNPGQFASNWCDLTTGMPASYTCILIPLPGDTSKYILFHQTSDYNLNYMSTELFFTKIDMIQNGGLGAVTQKNVIALQDTLCEGMTACKHANGRDWWITILKDNSDIIYTLLLTPLGITSINSQHLGVNPHYSFTGTPNFSPDGNKFAYLNEIHGSNGITITHELRLFDFDRCTGLFSNAQIITVVDSVKGLGLAFASNSQYLYFSSFSRIFQVNTDTSNVQASLDTVAVNDGYCYPYNFTCTNFWLMYLAANGYIYISSGSGTIDLHYINYPDSAGIACDVHQHGLRIPTYTGRSNVNHPNYYLGAEIGSVCDSLPHVGLQEHFLDVQNFQIAPNPLRESALKITYLLPQNKSGVFDVYDSNGKVIYSKKLPQWSTLQQIYLPNLSNGLYYCSVTSGSSRMTQKLVVIKN